jgi:peroxiredoxin
VDLSTAGDTVRGQSYPDLAPVIVVLQPRHHFLLHEALGEGYATAAVLELRTDEALELPKRFSVSADLTSFHWLPQFVCIIQMVYTTRVISLASTGSALGVGDLHDSAGARHHGNGGLGLLLAWFSGVCQAVEDQETRSLGFNLQCECAPAGCRVDVQIDEDITGGTRMPRASRNVAAITLVAAVVVASGSMVGAADFSLSTHDGKTFTLSAEQGKNGVLLMFFASWCAQSASQVDSIKAFVEQAGGQNVKVVGVSLQEDASTIKAFIDKKGINYPIVLDPEMTAAGSFGIEGIPTIVGIAVNGEVVFRGHAMPEDPTELIKKLTDAT